MDSTTQSLIIQRYTAGVVPRLISAETGYSKTQIHRVLRAAGINRSVAQAKRLAGYVVNERFFQTIDSYEKAQLLGFIYADGCVVSTRAALSVSIANEDHEYLEYMKRAMGYSGPVRVHPSRRSNEQAISNLLICSKTFCTDLINLGCIPRKSLVLHFPTLAQVPAQWLRAFMLGYFEGDGSLSGSRHKRGKVPYTDYVFTICGTEQFCYAYRDVLLREVGIRSSVVPHVNIHMLRLNGNLQIKRVMDWLYADAGYTLPRKLRAYHQLVAEIAATEERRAARRASALANASHPTNANGKTIYMIRGGIVYKVYGVSRFVAIEQLNVSARAWAMFRGEVEYKGWRLARPEEVATSESAGTIDLTYA